MSSKKGCPTYNFSVAIVKNDKDEFLAVKETKNRGWWLPAGRVDGAETFEEAAVRETLEEAGVKIKLKGILRVERTVQDSEQGVYARMRVVFYAEPDPPHQVPKVLSLSLAPGWKRLKGMGIFWTGIGREQEKRTPKRKLFLC